MRGKDLFDVNTKTWTSVFHSPWNKKQFAAENENTNSISSLKLYRTENGRRNCLKAPCLICVKLPWQTNCTGQNLLAGSTSNHFRARDCQDSFLPNGQAIARLVEARCCKAESRGYITGEVSWCNPPSSTMVLSSTHVSAEINIWDLPVVKGRPAHKVYNLAAV
jgi:hypothetical protein